MYAYPNETGPRNTARSSFKVDPPAKWLNKKLNIEFFLLTTNALGNENGVNEQSSLSAGMVNADSRVLKYNALNQPGT